MDAGEVVAGEVEVASEHPVGGQVVGLAAHRGQFIEHVYEEDLLGLLHFFGRNAVFLDLLDEFADRRLHGLPLAGIRRGTDAEDASGSRRVGIGADRVGQTFLFPNRLVDARTLALTENAGQNVQCRHVRVRDGRNVPRKMHLCQLGLELLVNVALP